MSYHEGDVEFRSSEMSNHDGGSSATDDDDIEISVQRRGSKDPQMKKRGAVTAFSNTDALRIGAIHEIKDFEDGHKGPIFKRSAEARLLEQLVISGNGSALRGWRWIVDPDGALEVSWNELERACRRMEFVHSEEELIACLKSEQPDRVTLSQVLSELGVLVQMFRRWISDSFGSQHAWFDALDLERSGLVTKDTFIGLCQAEGFSVSDEELSELFFFCDTTGKEAVTRDLTIFLEPDEKTRERELCKLQLGGTCEQDTIMVSCYNSDHLPMKERLHIRAWAKHTYEILPQISRQRIAAREKLLKKRGLQARVSFIRHLRRFHGTEVRAWRRGLGVDGQFVVNRSCFKHYCRKIQFEEDINALWGSLDAAGDGELQIEQFSLQAADVLASFLRWARRSFGSCAGLFQTPEAIKRRKQHRPDGTFFIKASMSLSAFSSLLWTYGFPPLFCNDGDVILWYLIVSLDFHGGSLISSSDLQWLDGWEPTEWLVADPDEEAWLEIRARLVDKFGHLLRAWRQELDTDNSNKLSWLEWCAACKHLGIEGNLAGAWRVLDVSRLGYITLKDICKEGAQMLNSFKMWAELRFGSMEESFRSMDSDGGGTLSRCELKCACYKYKCDIDAQLLFDVLSSNGRNISRKDFNFLNGWAPAEMDSVAEFNAVTEDLWQEALSTLSAHRSKPKPQPIQIRHAQTSVSKTPSRLGGLSVALSNSGIQADFDSGTVFPTSPYALPLRPKTALRPRTAPHRKNLRRSISDSNVAWN